MLSVFKRILSYWCHITSGNIMSNYKATLQKIFLYKLDKILYSLCTPIRLRKSPNFKSTL